MADDMTDDMTEEITEKNSTSVQNVSSAPSYISDFIGKNMDKLLEIYDEGLRENDEGALRMICSQKENKMDVMFLNEENIQHMITKESWGDLKNSRGNKKLIICHDSDLNAIFLIFL
jgi:hypothetical protein